jgi:sugar phosphate isomerase/epimerase
MSVQLYSARKELAADPDGTLARLADLGVRNVEAFGFVTGAAELAARLKQHGLAAPTGHATLLSPDLSIRGRAVPVPTHAETFEAAQQLGVQIVIDAFVPPERWADAADIARTATLLNEAAAEAAGYGLTVGYHNHSHEFAHSFDGVSAFELFAGQLDDGVVLEVDVFWAAAGGQDVPALLTRLGSRVRAIHVKDGPVIDDPFSSGAAFDQSSLRQVPLGQGEVPIVAILDAAPAAEYAVIEFDHYDGDIFEGIAEGIRFLAERGIS